VPRLSEITDRKSLPESAHEAFDSIAGSRGRVGGPFAMLMHSPELAARTAHVGTYVRFESVLPAPLRELATLAAARAMDCNYEWAAHSRLAREVGVGDRAIEVVARNEDPSDLELDEALVVRYARELLEAHRVSDETFEAVRERLGDQGLIDLTGTIGYYAMIACALNATQMEPAADAPRLPER
jgi:4-carboxymuconolactone decarboxylase